MYGDESKEDGEIRFHYNREERTGSGDSSGEGKPLLWRIFRMNRSTLIILLDILVLSVVFVIFRPMLFSTDHILETDDYKVELSGFLFEDTAYVSLKVLALEDTAGGPMSMLVWSGGATEKTALSDTVPVTEGKERVMRLELPVAEESDQVHATILLPGMEDPVTLTATLKE